MGLCNSCESTHVATAKVILQDGRLQEYSYPVRASYVLQKHPAAFLCNSDEMEFDDVVSAVNGEDLLQPGQLYFALPLSRLHRHLQPEEMAALAVKANSALMKSAEKCGCRRKSVAPMVFDGQQRVGKDQQRVASAAGNGGGLRRGRSSGRRGEKFTAMLSAIPE